MKERLPLKNLFLLRRWQRFIEVDGISFRDKNKNIIKTKARTQIENTNDILYPAYGLPDMKHYLVDPCECIKGFT